MVGSLIYGDTMERMLCSGVPTDPIFFKGHLNSFWFGNDCFGIICLFLN